MFEHLDDPSPVVADDATLARVQRRARVMRTRRALVPSVVVLVSIAVLVGVIANNNGGEHVVAGGATSTTTGAPAATFVVVPDVIGNSVNDALSTLHAAGFRAEATGGATGLGMNDTVTSQDPPPATKVARGSVVTVSIAKAGMLSSAIEVDHTTVASGGRLHATLVVVNNTGRAIDLSNGCAPKWAIALTKPGHTPDIAFTEECGAAPWHIPTGTSRFPMTVDATAKFCTTGSAGVPRCLPNGGMPPLAPGRYELQFVSRGPIPGFPVPRPVAIVVT
jgi:PASTA domain